MNTARRSSHSTQDELAAHQRQQLVDVLRQSGALRSPALEQAFLSIPREAFVPCFYEQEVTIERDAVLAAQARHTLEQVIGPGVTVVVGDGVVGWPPGAPYDRIIATASAATLPMAWVEQLHIGGRLVMDLQGSLASGFLVVEKTAESVSGHFLSEPLHFMPLETEAISLPQ